MTLSFSDGTLEYSMRQGDKRGLDVDFYDFIYDGRIADKFLTKGLGQLTDGEIGESNFRLDTHNSGIKGYEWIGWKNETWHGQPVEIIFKFDHIRNFTRMKIYSNNMYNKEVRVFQKARIYSSIGGVKFSETFVDYSHIRDELMEFSRFVIVPLKHIVGRYLKVHLYFDAKWMLISEVQFESSKSCFLYVLSAQKINLSCSEMKNIKNVSFYSVCKLEINSAKRQKH